LARAVAFYFGKGLNGIFSFTIAPMRISSFLGFGIVVLAFLYAVLSFVVGMFFDGATPRGTETIIVALFFFSGVQLIFIGLFGEHITAIHAHVTRSGVGRARADQFRFAARFGDPSHAMIEISVKLRRARPR
jgi:hypothetical protein